MGDELLYLNGKVLPLSEGRIHVEDRGFQLGDGVYEVVKVMNGRVLLLDEHLERLKNSLAAIRLTGASEVPGLDKVVPELVSKSQVVDGFVYIQVTRGVGPRDFEIPKSPDPTVIAYARSLPPLTTERILAGEVLHPVQDRRWALCNIKAVDLLASVLAKDEAKSAGADEAVFLGPNGRVREGVSSNVFAYLRGVLRTHPADDHVLEGITRRHVLESARQTGYAIGEEPFRLSDITSGSDPACEVFLASTLRGIMPVVRVGEHTVGDGRPGKVTLALLDRFRADQAALAGLETPTALS